jgi:hypothetical protein
MRLFMLILFLAATLTLSYAQSDSAEFELVTPPFPEYVIYRYDPLLHDTIASYNYSNKWDFDGDKKNDSLIFVGTGGVHSFFYLKITLTTNNQTREFPFIELDMPYLTNFEDLKKNKDNPGLQFVVHDFDSDGIVEIYLNVYAPHKQIPAQLKRLGITSPQLLINCSRQKLEIRNFKN